MENQNNTAVAENTDQSNAVENNSKQQDGFNQEIEHYLAKAFNREEKGKSDSSKVKESNDAPSAKETTKQASAPQEDKKPSSSMKTLDSLMPKAEKSDAKPIPVASTQKTEELPEDKIVGPSDKSSAESKANWTQLKTIAKQLRDELSREKLERERERQELEKLRPIVGDPESLKKKLEEYDSLSERAKIFDLENHPEFKSKYVVPVKNAVSDVKQALKDWEIEDVDVEGLLSKSRVDFKKSASQIVEKLPIMDQAEVRDKLNLAYSINEARKQELSKASEVQAKLQERNIEIQRGAFEDVYKEGFSYITPLEKPDNATPDDISEIEEYNRGVNSIRANAEKFAFGQTDEKQVAKLALKASTLDFIVNKGLPRIQKEFSKVQQERDELLNEVKSLRKHSVGTDFNGSNNSKPKELADMSTEEAVRHVFRR